MGVQYVLIYHRVQPKPSQPHLGRFLVLAFRQPDAVRFQLTDNTWAFSTHLSAAERNQNRASRIWLRSGSGLSATRRSQTSIDRQRMGIQDIFICRRLHLGRFWF